MSDNTIDIVFHHTSGADGRTTAEGFQQTARMHPDRIALRNPGGRQEVTWPEYAQRVEAIASGLAGRGASPHPIRTRSGRHADRTRDRG